MPEKPKSWFTASPHDARGRLTAGYEMLDRWFPEVPFVPHPDTEPAAVWAGQVADVRALLRRMRPVVPTVAFVSDELTLPLWSVRRALAELRLTAPDDPAAKSRGGAGYVRPAGRAALNGRVPFGERWAAVAAVLAAGGATLAQVADAVGVSRVVLTGVMQVALGRGLVVRTLAPAGARKHFIWTLPVASVKPRKGK